MGLYLGCSILSIIELFYIIIGPVLSKIMPLKRDQDEINELNELFTKSVRKIESINKLFMKLEEAKAELNPKSIKNE